MTKQYLLKKLGKNMFKDNLYIASISVCQYVECASQILFKKFVDKIMLLTILVLLLFISI